MSLILQGFGGNLILQGYEPETVDIVLPTLIVEDGSAKTDAESFCSAAYADDYFLRRGVTAWAVLTLNQKEENLRLATDYMEQEFRLRWAGYRYNELQSLSWPRWEVYNLDVAAGYYGWYNFLGYNTVPDLVKRATAELALRAVAGPLSIDTGRLKDRVRIGGNNGVDITYSKASSNQNKVYTAVESMLAPFLMDYSKPGQAHTIRLERA